MGIDIITAEDLSCLQQVLAFADINSNSETRDPNFLERLVVQFGHVKVQMYQERGPHKRPHFHIEYKREYRASYAIETLERIVGYMPKRYEAPVIERARSRQSQLATCWERVASGGQPFQIESSASP